MITCCVPSCYTNSRKCEEGVSFHEFPSSPDAAAKWIKNINTVVKNGGMWFPQDKAFICSNHFLPCDFKAEHKTPSLKPRSVPTVFRNIGIGHNSSKQLYKKRKNEDTKSPLIVKIIKHPDTEDCEGEMSKETLYSTNACDSGKLSADEVMELPANKETELVISNVRSLSDLVILPSNSNTSVKLSKNNMQTLNKYCGANENVHSLSTNQSSFSEQRTNLFSNTVENMRENLKQKLGANNKCISQTKVSELHKKKAAAVNKKTDSRVHKNSKQISPELIEIGPDTFLKINPEVIKVTKKVTPSGNTVLQFAMNQALAFNQKDNFLPTLVTKSNTLQSDSATNSQCSKTREQSKERPQIADVELNSTLNSNNSNKNKSESKNVEHVVGHLVDTHVCKETCNLTENRDDSELLVSSDMNNSTENVNNEKNNILNGTTEKNKKSNIAVSECIANAPVLMTTNLPVCHYFTDKQKLMSQLKQKTRQISSIRVKLNRLLKKTEELENKCIVQERQLSYANLKALKTIKKNAARGDANAMYILEQIRAYSGKSKMRWSESTLRQCSIWCRKAPYAYEYFRKAELFRLPCVGTVKRYMKSHPAMKPQAKNSNGDPNAEESSSDFDFDDSDSNESNVDGNENSAEWNEVVGATCKKVINQSFEGTTANQTFAVAGALNKPGQKSLSGEPERAQCIQEINMENSETVLSNEKLNRKVEEIGVVELSTINVEDFKTSTDVLPLKATSGELTQEAETAPADVSEEANSISLNVQEIILQSGEIVQCLNSKLGNGNDIENQYYIIPTMNDQTILTDHQYSVVQSHTVPLVIQNIESEQLPLEQQKQIIFIAENTEQPECSSTEFMSSS